VPSEAWLAILQAGQTGSRMWRELVAQSGSADEIRRRPGHELIAQGLDEPTVARLRNPDRRVLDHWHEWLDRPEHSLVTIADEQYPALLSETSDPPLALWIAGRRPSLLSAPQLGIVGSRNATAGGLRNAKDFAQYLGSQGLTITSGLAAGIDAASHEGALQTPSGTVAVLGCGIDIVYPRAHIDLAARIQSDGVVVSEYPPGTPPGRGQFPARNRIIAGLSVGVLIVEAGTQSGALITARLAAESGREIFAIPGSIHNPLARGCHRLIRQGAKLVEDAPSVLVELGALLQFEPAERQVSERVGDTAELESEYVELLRCVGYDPIGINELVERCGLTAAEVSSMLLLLELRGLVDAMPGGRYVRTA
jgi:DNA processing protein